MDTEKPVNQREDRKKDLDAWEKTRKKCIEDLRKAEDLLEKAGLPNPDLENIVSKARQRLTNVDRALKNMEQRLIGES